MTKSNIRKLYLRLVMGTGAVICSFSLYHFISSPQRTNPQLFILAIIALALGPCLIVRIPRLTSQITVSDTFIFLTMLLYGGDAAILLAALEAFCSSLRFSRKAITIFSNAAMLACATFLTSLTLTFSFGSITQLPRSGYSTTLMVALCLMALVQYIVNSGLVAIGVALKLERPLLQTWSKHYLWTSITYVAGASAAGIIARLVETVGFYSVMVTAPIIAVIFLTYRTYRENIEQAAAQAEQSERHAKELSLYIAERRRAEEERSQLLIREQQARAEAEEASRMKDEFLAMVSHELRTPLTPILGWIRMLSCDEIDRVTSMEAVESIERAAKYQESIINDLLDVSRITRGKLRLEMKQIQLMHVIEASLEVVRPAAEAKDILINCTNGPAQLLVSGDSGRLKQVMWNILSNAVKFTPIGGRIDIETKPSGSYAEIRVRDSGSGISADFLPYVFDRFRQADGSNNEALGGLGLGLALVRYLTEMHGGSAQAESLGVDRGATFTVRLPLLIAPQSPTRSETLAFENRQSRRAVRKACAEETVTTKGSTYPISFGWVKSTMQT
jgi:signal transduction histidine kinase